MMAAVNRLPTVWNACKPPNEQNRSSTLPTEHAVLTKDPPAITGFLVYQHYKARPFNEQIREAHDLVRKSIETTDLIQGDFDSLLTQSREQYDNLAVVATQAARMLKRCEKSKRMALRKAKDVRKNPEITEVVIHMSDDEMDGHNGS